MITAVNRALPIAAVAASTFAGLALRDATPVADQALARLVLFMVVLKVTAAFVVAALTTARLSRPGPGWRYALALAPAAAGPALISGVTHTALGAGCFYAGLALFSWTAWRDRAGWAYAARAISNWSRRGASPSTDTSVPPRGTSVQATPSSIGSLTSSSPVGVGL